MSLSAPRSFFGVHSFTPYSRTDGTFYGIVKVLKSSSLSLSGSLVNLNGGSSKYPWAVEEGEIKAEMSLKFGEFPDFLFTLFLGKTPSSNNAEATGAISSLTNVLNTSLMNATTGIASVAVLSGSETNLKFGHYLIVAVSSSTVDIYFSSDCDITRGSDGSYSTDTLKVAAAQTVTASTATNITAHGFKFTGGSGTIGLTTGDTASFMVRPENSGSMTVRVGGFVDQIFPEFGAIVMAQRRGNQEMLELDCFRMKAAGMPLNFAQNAWSEGDVKLMLMYDSAKDGLFDVRHVKPTLT